MTRRRLYRLLVGLILACGVVQLTMVAGAPAAPVTQGYVKYYTVTGASENLTEIAVKFLGSGSRSAEIYNLNSGRLQPDGSGLTDPARLNKGWSIVLPWDAVGNGVQYGLMPTGATPSPSPARATNSPAAPASPKPPTRTQNAPQQPVQTQSPKPSAPSSPSPSPSPSPPQSPQPPPGKPVNGSCGTTGATDARSTWAQQQLVPDKAWETTRGNGVVVAVIDSGVDASLPQLSGRVMPGADITSGTGVGDSDCLGSGTAMAAIIAGSSDQADTPSGIAPDATIMPIRVVDDKSESDPADEATAIEVAVSAGAQVIAVGAHVDLSDPAVSAAIADALAKDLLVIVAAGPGPMPQAPKGSSGALITVGAVGPDGKFAADFQGTSVDVVAPGMDVASLGINGSGTISASGPQYAVAFVAGQAALVRAAYPSLTAQQVKHRIESTSDKVGGQAAGSESRYGFGMINPAAAVTSAVDGEQVALPPVPDPGVSIGAVIALVVVVLIMLAAIGLLLLRARRWAQGPADPVEHELR
ncbi:S8 family serine peptidase [Catenuloplanes sp. NPDC051500]|uniref:S8 family serine peptidase n=1 Tax=Catenuloplanes sp. NPDC051500 TaxID=3363959 RepID=UPI003790CFF3